MVPLYKSWIHNSNTCKQLIKVQTHATWRTTCTIDASIIMAAWVQFRNEDIQRNWRKDRPVIVNNNWTNPNPVFLHPLNKYFEIGKSLSQNKNMKYFAVWEALEISISAYILSDNNFAWHVFNTGCLSPSQTKSRYARLSYFLLEIFPLPWLINELNVLSFIVVGLGPLGKRCKQFTVKNLHFAWLKACRRVMWGSINLGGLNDATSLVNKDNLNVYKEFAVKNWPQR